MWNITPILCLATTAQAIPIWGTVGAPYVSQSGPVRSLADLEEFAQLGTEASRAECLRRTANNNTKLNDLDADFKNQMGKYPPPAMCAVFFSSSIQGPFNAVNQLKMGASMDEVLEQLAGNRSGVEDLLNKVGLKIMPSGEINRVGDTVLKTFPNGVPDGAPRGLANRLSKAAPKHVAKTMPNGLPKEWVTASPKKLAKGLPNGFPKDMAKALGMRDTVRGRASGTRRQSLGGAVVGGSVTADARPGTYAGAGIGIGTGGLKGTENTINSTSVVTNEVAGTADVVAGTPGNVADESVKEVDKITGVADKVVGAGTDGAGRVAGGPQNTVENKADTATAGSDDLPGTVSNTGGFGGDAAGSASGGGSGGGGLGGSVSGDSSISSGGAASGGIV